MTRKSPTASGPSWGRTTASATSFPNRWSRTAASASTGRLSLAGSTWCRAGSRSTIRSGRRWTGWVADSDPEKYCVPLDTPYRYFAILYQVLPVEEETILPELAVEGRSALPLLGGVARRRVPGAGPDPDRRYGLGDHRAGGGRFGSGAALPAARHALPLLLHPPPDPPLRRRRSTSFPIWRWGRTRICLSWEAGPPEGSTCFGAAPASTNPVWDGLARVVADSELERHCLPLDTPYRYFSILDQTRPPTEEERVVPDLGGVGGRDLPVLGGGPRRGVPGAGPDPDRRSGLGGHRAGGGRF